MIWNDRLHSLRTENHLTLKEVAARIGLSEAMVSRHETSTKSIPYEVIEAYAQIYACSPAYIMGWDRSSPENLSTEESAIIRRYRVVDDSTKSAVCAVLGVERQEGEGLYGSDHFELDA